MIIAHIHCDGCRQEVPTRIRGANDQAQAAEIRCTLRSEGWITHDDGRDFCPICLPLDLCRRSETIDALAPMELWDRVSTLYREHTGRPLSHFCMESCGSAESAISAVTQGKDPCSPRALRVDTVGGGLRTIFLMRYKGESLAVTDRLHNEYSVGDSDEPMSCAQARATLKMALLVAEVDFVSTETKGEDHALPQRT